MKEGEGRMRVGDRMMDNGWMGMFPFVFNQNVAKGHAAGNR